MPRTRLQLANRALDKLQLVGSGQSPAPEDTQKANDVIDDFADFISSTEPPIYTIADLSAIENNAFEWLAVYLAYFIATDFGLPQNDAMRQMAEFNLRRIQASRPTYEVMRNEYF
jgi:hypothetical protein